jgi:hypothetical protein
MLQVELAAHVQGDAVACRVRLLELLGMILGAVGEQAGDRPSLVTETASTFEKLNRLETVDEMTAAFSTSVVKLLGLLQHRLPQTRGHLTQPLPQAGQQERGGDDGAVRVDGVARLVSR